MKKYRYDIRFLPFGAKKSMVETVFAFTLADAQQQIRNKHTGCAIYN